MAIEIGTAESLSKIGKYINYPLDGEYIQTADIDLSNYNTDGGWVPITVFTGSFDGNGFVIKNLFIDRPDDNLQGLFGLAEECNLSNVQILNANVTGETNVGTLVGLIVDSSINNCSAMYTYVESTDDCAGGLAGHVSDSIVDYCRSSGTVFGSNCTGGLLGQGYDTTVKNSSSFCGVTGDKNTGGLIGGFNGFAENCFSVGDVDGSERVGGLLGYLEGDVVRCYSKCKIENSGIFTGGLAGAVLGETSVDQSYFVVSIDGDGFVGGITGDIGSSLHINSCFVSGVIKNYGLFTGGLVSTTDSSEFIVENCFSTCDLAGVDFVGGLAGSVGKNTFITYCYSTGSVNGDEYVGGLAGDDSWNSASISNSYWDTETSGQIISAGGEGKTTLEMKDIITFTNWDIVKFVDLDINNPSTWFIEEDNYPILSWEALMPGSKWMPFEIYTAEDLRKVGSGMDGWNLDCHYIQMNNVDISNYSGGEGWEPIGDDSESFMGQYNGQDFKISGLTIDRDYGYYHGLFGYASNAYFSNVEIDSANVSGNSNVGCIVGHATNCVIRDCSVTGIVSCNSSWVGGIVGYTRQARIEGCSFDGSVQGKDVGGILGGGYDTAIINCHTSGTVYSINSAGGITSDLYDRDDNYLHYRIVEDCSSDTFVSGGRYVGGLIGSVEGDYQVVNCYYENTSEESVVDNNAAPNNAVGGLIGLSDNTVVNGCSSIANVKGYYSFGGLIGQVWDGKIHGCYVYGKVVAVPGLQGGGNVGGLIGHLSYAEVDNCRVESNISVEESGGGYSFYVGGLIGLCYEGEVAGCFFSGKIVHKPTDYRYGGSVGGIIGNADYTEISGCCAHGNIEDETYGLWDGPMIGGFCGYWYGQSIADCYIEMSITSNNNVGGFAWTVDDATITNCYSACSINGGEDSGGFTTDGYRLDVVSSYWDAELSGLDESFVGEGKNTSEMQNIDTFVGWDICNVDEFDFNNPSVWFINDGDDYPRLWWEYIPTIKVDNKSDVSIYPEILIKKIDGKGDVTITNLDTGQMFKFTDLENDEIIYINNDKEIITSNLHFENPSNRFDGQFLFLIKDINILEVNGNCEVKLRYRHKYLPQTGGDFDAN